MWVLDASIAVKWFFSDESYHKEALAILDKITISPLSYVVPDFFFHEISAVLTRKSKWDRPFILESLKTVYQYGLSTFPIGEELSQMAIELSCSYKISFYDSIYVALAKNIHGQWLTTDEKALKKIDKKLALHLCSFP